MGSKTEQTYIKHRLQEGRCYNLKVTRIEEYLGPCEIHNPPKKKPGRKPKNT